MANPAKVILKIESVERKCKANPKVGKEFDLSRPISVGYSGDGQSLCPTAFYAAFPNWRVLRHGGEIPEEQDKDLSHISCPARNISMVLKRIKE